MRKLPFWKSMLIYYVIVNMLPIAICILIAQIITNMREIFNNKKEK